MKKKQTIQRFFAGLAFIFALFAFVAPLSQPVQAAEQEGRKCGGVDTAILSCDGSTDAKTMEGTGIWQLLLLGINILTVGVGVAALAGVVYGAFLYTSAGGNPDKVKKAKELFVNVVIGVIAFAAMYALLNFLVPGGLFT